MLRSTAKRMWALEPATYRSPAQLKEFGGAAPEIPFPIYLIEHADGLVLFDAGLDPDAAGDPAAVYGEMAERIAIRFDERHLIEAQLAQWGFSLADVGVVIASHLHFDHAGALKQFPHARILLGTGELDYAMAPERFSSTWFRPEDWQGLDFDEIDTDVDLWGDGSVSALHLPGHTPGSLGALVRLPGSSYILTGDAVHTRQAYESEIHYHGDVDSRTARATLRRLTSLADTEQAGVWIAHDTDDWQRFGGAGEKR